MTDSRNKLNDLTNTEWLVETKSVWYSKPPKRDKHKKDHPATFAESDIERLVRFFTKAEERVLDPFSGTGSTLLACEAAERYGVGIELIDNWVDVTNARLAEMQTPHKQTVVQGDAREVLKEMEPESFDFIVTSPPYWMILRKDTDHKARNERKNQGLKTRYSDEDDDLGNIESYEVFLKELRKVFESCHRVLRAGRYMCVIVSDFRHKSDFLPYHMDITNTVSSAGLKLEGITVLVQDSKNLYPYGMPYAFVSNIHHQYILVFRKPALK